MADDLNNSETKHNDLMTNELMTKKHQLKPGVHQFAPGSHPEHDAGNLSDEDAEWYLERYPHIAALFEKSPEDRESESPAQRSSPISEIPTTISEIPPEIGEIITTISEIPT